MPAKRDDLTLGRGNFEEDDGALQKKPKRFSWLHSSLDPLTLRQQEQTMDAQNKTVLITGGASGIGLALAERFLKAGSKVIICGRRAEKLAEAKEKNPSILTLVGDVSTAEQRVALFNAVSEQFPEVNVLVNNAGTQRRFPVTEDPINWDQSREEIATNFEAPVHLSLLFIPLLLKNTASTPYILNVTSGLAFVPIAAAPVYCATKAALHSFTLSLRHQLSTTPIKVIEVIPPAVQTDLGGPGKHTFGVPLDEYADATFAGIIEGAQQEVPYGFAAKVVNASRQELNAAFDQINAAVPKFD